MRKRDIVVIGGVLAVVIATAVVLTHGCRSVKEDGCPEDWPDPGVIGHVLVATQDIQAGEAMDAVIEDGHLEEIQVPLDRLVEGAATEVSEIEGKTATKPIEKDEQISLEYLR